MKITILDCELKRKTIYAKSFTFLFGLDAFVYWDEYDNHNLLPLSDIYSITYQS